jgi:Uma2 family endonuclease
MTQTITLSPNQEQSSTHLSRPVLLTNISWTTYESILKDWEEKAGYHLTYDQGLLEIMPPLDPHEGNKTLIGRFVETITEELEIEIRSLGSRTCKRKDLLKGFEPDECYYIENEDKIWNKRQIDLAEDPPPDLIIEIDITSSSLKSLELYAAFGVPEVWLYDEKTIRFYRLENQSYIESTNSAAFPFLAASDIAYFLELKKTTKETSLIKQFRQWIKNKTSVN